MDKKKIVAGISILALMIVGIAALMLLLFGGGSSERMSESVKRTEPLFCAVPSNAVALAKFDRLETAASEVLFQDLPQVKGKGGFGKALADAISSGSLSQLSKRPVAIALQYSKTLVPLYIFDAGRSGKPDFDLEVEQLGQIATAHACAFNDCDCSKILSAVPELKNRRLVLVSSSENAVNASLRHINDGVSIYQTDGFASVFPYIDGDSNFFFSISDSGNILPSLILSSRRYSKFLNSFAKWCGAEMSFEESGLDISAKLFSSDQADFCHIFESQKPSSSEVFEAVPADVLSVISLPLDSYEDYVEAYDSWLGTQMRLNQMTDKRKSLAATAGTSPKEWAAKIRPVEVAVVSFRKGDNVLTANLMRLRKSKGAEGIQEYPYGGFLASLFGDAFLREDETCSFAFDEWIVTGSREAVEEWASGRALEYNLHSKFCDSGLKTYIPDSGNAVLYFSADVESTCAEPYFIPSVRKALSAWLEKSDIMPTILCLSSEKGRLSLQASVLHADMKRSKAPSVERDVHINIPEGPFPVKNSATGKTNTLVQNANLKLTLKDHNSKSVWTVPFSEKLCGTVSNVDYYANGKLQFIFGAGSKVYLLDRLGHFVSPFPLELGKKIVLGPAVFDFSGSKRYNIMVLHGDNTIRMYNLQGKTPSDWKDITSSDTIVSLPERIVCGNSSVWAVRTSRQTLIFPFMGGTPITKFTGDSILLPDTEISYSGEGTIAAKSYNGKTQKIKIK